MRTAVYGLRMNSGRPFPPSLDMRVTLWKAWGRRYESPEPALSNEVLAVRAKE